MLTGGLKRLVGAATLAVQLMIGMSSMAAAVKVKPRLGASPVGIGREITGKTALDSLRNFSLDEVSIGPSVTSQHAQLMKKFQSQRQHSQEDSQRSSSFKTFVYSGIGVPRSAGMGGGVR